MAKPKSRGPKLARTAVREAMEASLLGKVTQEHESLFRTMEEAPEALLGVSSPTFRRLKEACTAVHGDEQEILVVAQALMLCGLPYKPVSGSHYVRQARTSQGTVRLVVTATDPDVALPFGKDRVVLAWITTKALQQDSPVVTWESSAEFFDLMGLDKGGKSYRAFAESWKRLSRAAFTLQFINESRDRGHLAPIFEDWDLPTLRDDQKESTGLTRLPGINYSATLSPRMWSHLKECPVPLRLEIMREFQDEPKAWDFVSFVCWRSWKCELAKAEGGNSIARIPYQELMQQLGSTDKDHKRLRKTLKDILERLGVIWPELQAGFIRAGVLEIRPPLNGIHPVKPR